MFGKQDECSVQVTRGPRQLSASVWLSQAGLRLDIHGPELVPLLLVSQTLSLSVFAEKVFDLRVWLKAKELLALLLS